MSKIALVHDYFVQMGGAERVAEAMHDSFPGAPMYTTVALQKSLPDRLRSADIRTGKHGGKVSNFAIERRLVEVQSIDHLETASLQRV